MTVGHLGVCHPVDVNWLAISRTASLLVVTWQLRNYLAACPLAICDLGAYHLAYKLAARRLSACPAALGASVLSVLWMASGLVHVLSACCLAACPLDVCELAVCYLAGCEIVDGWHWSAKTSGPYL